MPDVNFIKNITSKDINLSKNTISNMIKSASLDSFKELCEKSDFIFPFLKDRITNDFVKLIEKQDLKTVFEFSKIYCFDFENLIVDSWLKFASEDLTDEILEVFDNGTDEQKAYCALYFKHIQDSLALEYLNKSAYSDFEPLKVNCAQTLSAFKDYDVYNEMKNIVLNSNDDFEKNSAYAFLSAFKGVDAINFILDNCFNSPFEVQIIANLLDYNNFDSLKNLEQDKIIQIFSAISEGYPEDIGLETIGYYRILDFVKLIYSYNNQYSRNALILAREKFKEFTQNDIYSFDLDKNTKDDLKEIYGFLNNINLDIVLDEELKQYDSQRYDLALSVIQELKLNKYTSLIAQNMFLVDDKYKAKTSLILKEMNCANLISPEILNKIQNENVKILVQSCIN